jgi:23S rRNA pseudouridine1911/1915/1917 synthase
LAKKKKFTFKVIYQDKDILISAKPAGLLTVPIRDMPSTNLQQLVQQKFGVKARPVHRIDRYTSGIVAFALNKKSYENLVDQFRSHEPDRIYMALVRGVIKEDEGTLVHFMKLVKRGFRNILVKNEEEGTRAELHFEVIERFKDTSLVAIALETGLKNQIRVQFEAIGHPVVGDRHYSEVEIEEKLIDRQALHAYQLAITHPVTGKRLFFTSDIPMDMQKLIDHYRTV